MNVISEAERIKDRLRNAATVSDVEAVADEERATVKAMGETDEGKPLWHHIVNLKRYRLRLIQQADES